MREAKFGRVCKTIAGEARALASAEGVTINWTPLEVAISRAFARYGDELPSVPIAQQTGQPTGIENANGEIVRRCHSLGIKAPANDLITRLVKRAARLPLPEFEKLLKIVAELPIPDGGGCGDGGSFDYQGVAEPSGFTLRQTSHAGEIGQGPIYDRELGLIVGGLSLPCSKVGTIADFRPARSGGLSIEPAHCVKAVRACETLQYILGRQVHGVLRLKPIDPTVPTKAGFGTSSSDIAASLRAVLRALGIPDSSSPQLRAMVATMIEPSDQLFFSGEKAILFGFRTGLVLEEFNNRIPTASALSFDMGVEVDTVKLADQQSKSGFSDDHIGDFVFVLAMLRRAIEEQDVQLLAMAASKSGELNQQVLQFPNYNEVVATGTRAEALGTAISHSGSCATFLFDPEVVAANPNLIKRAKDLVTAKFGITWFIEHQIN